MSYYEVIVLAESQEEAISEDGRAYPYFYICYLNPLVTDEKIYSIYS